jgi:hypothetical protein
MKLRNVRRTGDIREVIDLLWAIAETLGVSEGATMRIPETEFRRNPDEEKP